MHGTMETACFDTHSTSPKQEKKGGGVIIIFNRNKGQ